MDYWKELVEDALLDAGVTGVTEEQLDLIASTIEGGCENYGLATGRDCIPDPRDEELASLKTQLVIEQEKILCAKCGGSGEDRTYGPVHVSISTCSRCRGEGRHSR